jgi:hypothetical protein
MQFQRSVRDGLSQVTLEAQRGRCAGIHIAVKQAVGSFARELGMMRRNVRVGNQLFRIAVAGENRNADRTRHFDFVIVEMGRFAQRQPIRSCTVSSGGSSRSRPATHSFSSARCGELVLGRAGLLVAICA